MDTGRRPRANEDLSDRRKHLPFVLGFSEDLVIPAIQLNSKAVARQARRNAPISIVHPDLGQRWIRRDVDPRLGRTRSQKKQNQRRTNYPPHTFFTVYAFAPRRAAPRAILGQFRTGRSPSQSRTRSLLRSSRFLRSPGSVSCPKDLR